MSFVFFVTFVSGVARASAQPSDAVGVRAQGMAGAFTAIADDATATWWNPAGLAGGAYINLVLEYGQRGEPADREAKQRGFAIAFPALGLSYYRMTVSEMRAPGSTDVSSAGRQDVGSPGVRTLEVSQFGATVGQSMGNHLVVASTLKLVRGLDDSDAGFDVGALAMVGRVRAGLMVRNAREATIGEGDQALTLRRHFRAGAAFSTSANTAYGGASMAFDADLQRVPTLLGEERRIAVGGEVWTRNRWLGGRAGLSTSTIGDARRSLSAGVSLGVRRGMFAEAQFTGGSDELRKGWSFALRLTF